MPRTQTATSQHPHPPPATPTHPPPTAQTTPLYEELEKQFYEELEGRVEKKVEEALSRESGSGRCVGQGAWVLWGVVGRGGTMPARG